jgi:hypothetical protein
MTHAVTELELVVLFRGKLRVLPVGIPALPQFIRLGNTLLSHAMLVEYIHDAPHIGGDPRLLHLMPMPIIEVIRQLMLGLGVHPVQEVGLEKSKPHARTRESVNHCQG